MTITPSSTAPGEAAGKPADIHFYFDPVCPFAWTTSKRVRTVAPLYEAVSSEIFDSSRAAEITAQERGSRTFVEPLLSRAGLPAGLADALDDTGWDSELQAETDHALTLIGKDVGTPIIHFQPPEGSRSSAGHQPSARPAGRGQAVGPRRRPGFPGSAGIEEDWHGGSRRQKK